MTDEAVIINSEMHTDLTNAVMYDNPWPTFAKLRSAAPVSRTKTRMAQGKDAVIVTRYEDVVALYKDPRFSSDLLAQGKSGFVMRLLPKAVRLLGDSMVFKDDPDHRRLRRLVDGTFTPRMIAKLESSIEQITDDLIQNMAERALAGETIDLVRDYALPLPLTVISEMLGVPQNDRHQFHGWVSQFLDSADSTSSLSMFKTIPVAHKMMKLFERLVALRRREPDDRVITALITTSKEGNTLSDWEVLAMIFLLLLAGHETTTSLIGSGTLALIEQPEEKNKLLAEPKLIDTAVEELLRFTSPVTSGAARIALEDVQFGENFIPKGSYVMGMLSSANHDESVFDNPERLDLAREPNRHVAFGMGNHLCLGIWLARLEAKTAINALIQRFPNLQLAVPRSELQWKPSETLRGLRALPLNLNP